MNSPTADSKAPLLLKTSKTCLSYKYLRADLDIFALNPQFESQRYKNTIATETGFSQPSEK